MGMEGGMMLSKDLSAGNGSNEAKKKEIKVTSPEEYLEIIKEHPAEEIDTDESSKKWIEQHHAIEAKVWRAKKENRFKKYSDLGLLEEEVGYFPRKGIADSNTHKLLKAWAENIEAGYHVEIIPVFNENNEKIGNRLFRTKKETIERNAEAKAELDLELQDEDEHYWFYQEQEKQKELEEKVRNGEMVYLGEMTFNEYVELIKKDFPSELVEEVAVFDEDKERVTNIDRYYARVG